MIENLLHQYWNNEILYINFIIILNLFGALLLGTLLGYERAYQGRAAGMRTYGIVCMASCALTVFAGYPKEWFGAHLSYFINSDPTRVIQGVITGVGFLGSAVVMKDGFSISGLSTAASIWVCCAIGIFIGVGFYSAAIALTMLSLLSMIGIAKVEQNLPQKRAIFVKINFKKGMVPSETKLRQLAHQKGYKIQEEGITVMMKDHHQEWSFMALSDPKKECAGITEISSLLETYEAISSFQIAPSRH